MSSSEHDNAPPVSDYLLSIAQLDALIEQLGQFSASLDESIGQETSLLQTMAETRQQWRKTHSPPSIALNASWETLSDYKTAVYAPHWEIATHPQKGRIGVATQDISPTTLALVEPVWVHCPQPSQQTTEEPGQLHEQPNSWELWWHLLQSCATLTASQLHLLQHMADTLDFQHKDCLFYLSSRPLPSLPSHFPQDLDELSHLMGILATNGISFPSTSQGPAHTGLFPMAAMLSHSCAPNCRFVVEDNVLYFHAIEPISAGEELTHQYISFHSTPATPTPQGPSLPRQAQLQSRFGFICQCSRCLTELSQRND